MPLNWGVPKCELLTERLLGMACESETAVEKEILVPAGWQSAPPKKLMGLCNTFSFPGRVLRFFIYLYYA